MKRPVTAMLTMAVWSAVASPVVAADADARQPLICAPINIFSCVPGGNCDRETAESVNLPQFFKVDMADKKITGTRVNGAPLATEIRNISQLPETMVLQGTEGNYMWNLMIAEKSGAMTLTVGGNEVGFVAFGACVTD
jgi:hypothetical protein